MRFSVVKRTRLLSQRAKQISGRVAVRRRQGWVGARHASRRFSGFPRCYIAGALWQDARVPSVLRKTGCGLHYSCVGDWTSDLSKAQAFGHSAEALGKVVGERL